MTVKTASNFKNAWAMCNVQYGSNWVEVTSPPTSRFPDGNTLRLEIGPCGDWTWFTQEEQNFLRKLTQGESSEDSEMKLSFPEMLMFKCICEKHEERQKQEQAEVEKEIALPPDIEDRIRKLYHICRNLKRTAFDKRPLYRISWYVPTRVSNPVSKGGQGMFANNAARVKARGMAEFDGSNYYGFADSKPEDLIREMNEWNARPEVAMTEFLPKHMRLLVKCDWNEVHPSEMEQRRDEAFKALRDNLVTVQLSLMDNVKKAEDTLATTLAELAQQANKATNKQLAEAHKKRVSNTYSAVRAAKIEMDNAIKSATMFDELEELEPLFEGLRQAIKAGNAALLTAKRAAKQY